MNRHLRQFLRQLWLRELVLLALVFKALIPVGYMPSVDAGGLPTLKLCAYYDVAAPQAGDAPSQPQGSGDAVDHSEHGPCPLGVAAANSAPPPAIVSYDPAPDPAWSAAAKADQTAEYQSPAPRSRPARGPPVLA